MADTRTLTRTLLQVEHADGKLVLVGDPAQLAAVGPGGLFAALVERNDAIELHDNRRQLDALERRALVLLREGGSRDYVAHAAEQGRLRVAETRTEAKAQLVADWWQAASSDPAGCVMIAYRRADVAELNAVARTLLDREGRLGPERLGLAGSSSRSATASSVPATTARSASATATVAPSSASTASSERSSSSSTTAAC